MKDSTKVSVSLNCSAGVSLLIVLLGFGLSQSANASSGWLAYLGRFHPVVLHLPIGLLAGYLLLLICQASCRESAKGLSLASDCLLAGTSLSAAIATAAGFLLAAEGGYNAELLGAHKLQAVIFTLALVVAAVARAQALARGHGPWRLGHGLALLVAVCLSVSAGHQGGALTHGTSYLTEFAPAWLRASGPDQIHAAAAAPASETTSGTDAISVMEIFETHCFQCHGAEKQKGGYRMDNAEALFAGGNSDLAAIVPWQAMNSYLVELITLPAEEDEVMPPAGKGELSDQEIMQIIRWIAEGAQL